MVNKRTKKVKLKTTNFKNREGLELLPGSALAALAHVNMVKKYIIEYIYM